MSILYWDGFENPDNPNWTMWGWGAPVWDEDTGRDGGAIRMSDTWGAAICDAVVPPWSEGFAVGVAVRPTGVDNRWGIFMFGVSPSTVYVNNCGLCCENGHLMWCKGAGDLYGGYLGNIVCYTGGIVRAQCWNFIEMHVHSGYITLWVNGLYIPPVPVEFFVYDGWQLDKVALGARTQWIRSDTATRYFDDFYIGELLPDDAPIGDLAVTTFFPVSDGTHTDWDCKTGTDHYAMVDEPPPDDADGTYVVSPEEDGIGNQDTYVFDVTEHSGTPIDVLPIWRARKTNIGPRTMRAISRLGTTEVYSDPFHVYGWWVDDSIHLTDYQTYPRGEEYFTLPLDPDGNAWTWENLVICEFGQEIYT